MSTLELNTITKLANKSSSENVEIIFGTAIDGELGDSVRVTIIATGFNNNDHEINEVIDSDEKIEEESQFSLFEKSDIEFIPNDNEEEVVHNMDDDYDECEDTFENDDKEIETNDRSEDVVIEELDGYDDNEVDHSSKKNDYILKRKERINNYKNNIYQEDPYHQKLAIPAFKRKNINLDEEDSLQTGNSKTIDFSEED